MRLNKLKFAALLLLSLGLSACGSGGGGGAIITQPSTGSSTIQSNASGVTTLPSTLALAGATISIPAGTTLLAADGTPVAGSVVVNASYDINAAFLPAAAQAAPANTTLKAYLDMVMSAGNLTVKTISPAIPVKMAVALPNGTAVEIWSHSGVAGAAWVKEISTTVTGGSVTFQVSHLSIYGCFQRDLTGITCGNNGGVTVQ